MKISEMTASPSEDKTCRMCGYADRSNLNIFQTRQIYQKILALYPIVLYKSDPLPKNICLKCYANTLKRYEEYIRISKIQTRWINNVRNNQPNNPYIRILDKIEETNRNLIEDLRRIGDESLDDTFSVIKHSGNLLPEDILTPSSSFRINNQSYSSTRDEREKKFTDHSTNKILLSHLKGENKSNNLDFKSNGFVNNESNNPTTKIRSSTNFDNFPKNKCRYCFKVLPNQKYLAFHQLKYHLGLDVFKSFTKKPLPKRFRSGQVIKINNKTCLRCNNCGKCFEGYDSILNHWINKKCEFYCLICGKEYPNDPSPLKKHIKLKHSLEYDTYKNITKRGQRCISNKKNPVASPQPNELQENPLEIDFEKESSFEFINVAENPKIPVLKLKRKNNSEREEFDIKVEKMYDSSSYPDSPSSFNVNEAIEKPFLRVKDLSELQCKPLDDDEDYISLNDFKLNTLSLENDDPCSTKENFLDEM